MQRFFFKQSNFFLCDAYNCFQNMTIGNSPYLSVLDKINRTLTVENSDLVHAEKISNLKVK
jgi:hypothetical protein